MKHLDERIVRLAGNMGSGKIVKNACETCKPPFFGLAQDRPRSKWIEPSDGPSGQLEGAGGVC